MGYLWQNGGLCMAGDYIITGGRPLNGTVWVPAAKNSVLPLLAASLLCSGPVRLCGVPELADVAESLALLRSAGCTAERQGADVRVDGVPGRADGYIRPEHHAVSDAHAPVVHNRQVKIRIEMVADRRVTAVGKVDGRFQPQRFPRSAQQLADQLFAPFLVHRIGLVIPKTQLLAFAALRFDDLFVFQILLRGMPVLRENLSAFDLFF